MDDTVSTAINSTGAALLAGGVCAAASLPLLGLFYSVWPKVAPGCVWPSGDTLLAVPLSGILGAGAAATWVRYQASHTETAVRLARCTSMVVVIALIWHFVGLAPAGFSRTSYISLSERLAEVLPMYLSLLLPAAFLLRWQHRASRRLQQLRAAAATYNPHD